MKHEETYIVKAADERPARKDGTCFYCSQPIGGLHKEGCVIRSRTVLCEFTVTLVRRVPEDWDAHMIEFHMNDSSWCAGNLIHEMKEIDGDDNCLCANVSGRLVREATKEDEEVYGVTR
jgi:hypothetical protein